MNNFFTIPRSISLTAIIVFLLCLKGFSQTEIPAGEVSGLWTRANSPYFIKGEITIPDGEKLTIEPGVNVIVTGHFKFIIEGSLLAIGTLQDTIIFTA